MIVSMKLKHFAFCNPDGISGHVTNAIQLVKPVMGHIDLLIIVYGLHMGDSVINESHILNPIAND